MDVGELLSFKPEQTPKRPHEDDDDYLATSAEDATTKNSKRDEKSKRMRRIEKAKESADFAKSDLPSLEAFFGPELTHEERLNILNYVESEEVEGEALDEMGLKKLLLVFEKRNLKNQEMRIKYPDNPY